MKPITFSKSFIFDQDIIKVQDLLVEDDFSYEIKETDLVISGKITGSGSAKSELDLYPFSFAIDVDCLLSLAKIDCLTDLKLNFKEYKTAIDGKLVTVTLKYELFGNGEPYKDVVTKEDKDFQRELYEAVSAQLPAEPQPFLDSEFKAKIDEIVGSDVEIISTLESLEPLDSFEDLDEDDSTIEFEPPAEIETPVIDAEPIPFPEPVEKPVFRDTVEELPVMSPTDIKKDPIEQSASEKPMVVSAKKSDLFSTEKYEIAYLYYKVKEGEDYESVADKFHKDPTLLRSCNASKTLKDGVLLKIPNR